MIPEKNQRFIAVSMKLTARMPWGTALRTEMKMKNTMSRILNLVPGFPSFRSRTIFRTFMPIAMRRNRGSMTAAGITKRFGRKLS